MSYIRAAKYQRKIDVSLKQMMENVCDWEHLPHLHDSTFASFQIITKGLQSFMAQAEISTVGLKFRQKFSLQASKKRGLWIVRVLSGFQKGLIIYSKATTCSGSGIQVDVSFFIPTKKWFYWPLLQLAPFTYKRLYDEDIRMMLARKEQLTKPRDEKVTEKICLGKLRTVLDSVPMTVDIEGRGYNIVEHNGQIHAFPTRCPHWNAPLTPKDCTNSTVKCPWHGYMFDLEKSGESNMRNLKLKCPKILNLSGQMWLVP